MPLITNSTNVHAADWENDTGDMLVTFKNNSRYRYKNVPRSIFEGLLMSHSPGKYMHKSVIKKFVTVRVEDLKA